MKKLIPFDIDKAKAGAKVVFRCGEPVKQWFHFENCNLNFPIFALITKSSFDNFTITGEQRHRGGTSNYDLMLEVEPTLRPWKAEEVPVGCLLRHKQPDSPHNKTILVSLNHHDIAFGKHGWLNLNQVFEQLEHSLDNGKTWQPCGVEE